MPNPTYSAASWADDTAVNEHWADAPTTGTARARLLNVATSQCRAYGPVLASGDTIPDTYVLATIYQARELHNAILRGETDIVGVGDYAIRVRPLTGVVRALLRPEPGIPAIG